MVNNDGNTNPPANVISSMLKLTHSLSVYAQDMPYALDAQITELELSTGQMVLEIEYAGPDIERYLTRDSLSFDLEALKGPHLNVRESYSLSNISAKLFKTDWMSYRLECQLPESVLVNEHRSSVRIPLILGMSARVNIEVFQHELNVPGRLRNLSTGGCLIDVNMDESIALGINQEIPGVTLEFPNGDRFFAKGNIRHIRPFGNHGYVSVGIQFIDLSADQTESIFHYVNESEREVIYRTGSNDKLNAPSPLFIPGTREKNILYRETLDQEKLARQAPMERGVMEVAHKLQVGLMYIKTNNLFPSEIFYDCVDTLRFLLDKDRKAFLYALAFLRDEPDWVRHAVQVTGQLADMLLIRDPHDPQVREAMLGALLHNMGKPLLISANLPSLKITMNPAQKTILREHVVTLRNKLLEIGWEPGSTCRDVIENANECLDGTGYPAGKRAEELSELVRTVSVIKAVNKLLFARNGMPPHTPLDAYRKVNESDPAFDKTILVEYIQNNGLYPIGSLAKFSGGFLAWVMDIDGRGKPVQVHVVKNLRFPDTNNNSVISLSDLSQIGKLEDIVNPADFGIKILKI